MGALKVNVGGTWVNALTSLTPPVMSDGFTRVVSATSSTFAIAQGFQKVALPYTGVAQGSPYSTPNNIDFYTPADGVYSLSAQLSASSTPFPAGVVLAILANDIAIIRSVSAGGQAFETVTTSSQMWLAANTKLGIGIYAPSATTGRITGWGGGSSTDTASPYLSVWRGGTGPKGDVGPQGSGLPPGGTTGQVLTKASNTTGDATWTDPATGVGNWTALSLNSGWSNYGSGWANAYSRLLNFGNTVQLQGLIINTGSNAQIGFVTPAHAPNANHLWLGVLHPTSLGSGDSFCTFQIDTSGNIAIRMATGVNAPAGSSYVTNISIARAYDYMSLTCVYPKT